MNRAQVITEDFLSSDKPILIARAGVRALDQQTGILYEQVKVPHGAVYQKVGTFYYQPINPTGAGAQAGQAWAGDGRNRKAGAAQG